MLFQIQLTIPTPYTYIFSFTYGRLNSARSSLLRRSAIFVWAQVMSSIKGKVKASFASIRVPAPRLCHRVAHPPRRRCAPERRQFEPETSAASHATHHQLLRVQVLSDAHTTEQHERINYWTVIPRNRRLWFKIHVERGYGTTTPGAREHGDEDPRPRQDRPADLREFDARRWSQC